MHCPKGSLKEEKQKTMQNNKKPYWEAITALLPEYKQPLKLPSRCYSTSVKIYISDERQAGTSLKHKTILKPVVCAAAILALRRFTEKRQGIEATLKMVFHTQQTLIHNQLNTKLYLCIQQKYFKVDISYNWH